MHMADALVSAPVALAAGAASATLIAVAAKKARSDNGADSMALMGVMGAFVFVAQMINFAIPGTGSSGHIIGGILLAAMLGPWRGFLTLCSVLIVQCLVFADGGLMALGCNVLNMGAMSCLVAYPLIYKPLVRGKATVGRIMLASVLACVVGIELGALLVSIETWASGITLLPLGSFLMFMLPIHLVIGVCEGVATGLVLSFVLKQDADLLQSCASVPERKGRKGRVLAIFGIVAAVLAVAAIWIASANPDGLEWSIANVAGRAELGPAMTPPTALMPDYESHFSGIVGGVLVMMVLWALSAVLFRRQKT